MLFKFRDSLFANRLNRWCNGCSMRIESPVFIFKCFGMVFIFWFKIVFFGCVYYYPVRRIFQ